MGQGPHAPEEPGVGARAGRRSRQKQRGGEEPPSIDPVPLFTKVLTVSDGVVAGTRDDVSGRALTERLIAEGYVVVEHRITEDGTEAVAAALKDLTDGQIFYIIKNGKGQMPPDGGRTKPDDIWNFVILLRSFAKK